MSPTDSQPKPKGSSGQAASMSRPSSQPSLTRTLTDAVSDITLVGREFVETLLSVSRERSVPGVTEQDLSR